MVVNSEKDGTLDSARPRAESGKATSGEGDSFGKSGGSIGGELGTHAGRSISDRRWQRRFDFTIGANDFLNCYSCTVLGGSNFCILRFAILDY